MMPADDLWLVMCPDGETRSMSLDDLVGHFDAGHLEASALVKAPNDVFWKTIAELAGLDEEEESPATTPDAPAMDVDVDIASLRAPAPAPAPASGVPHPASTGITLAPVVSPVTHAYAAPMMTAPLPPMRSTQFSIDMMMMQQRSSRWRRPAALIAGAVATVTLLIAVASAAASAPAPAIEASNALQAPPALQFTPVPPAPQVVAPAPTSATPAAAPGAKLSEDQKKALAAKDKAAASKSKTRAKAPAAAPRAKSSKASNNTFSKGGDKHDPLNGAL